VCRLRSMELPNLEIRTPVPKSQVPSVLARADCLLCCFKNSPVYQYGLSMSKLCEYLISGRPVVLSVDSAYDPVAEAAAGISVKGEDPQMLARALQTMADLPFRARKTMGQCGIAWARQHHDVRTVADRLEGVLLAGRPFRGCST